MVTKQGAWLSRVRAWFLVSHGLTPPTRGCVIRDVTRPRPLPALSAGPDGGGDTAKGGGGQRPLTSDPGEPLPWCSAARGRPRPHLWGEMG